MRVVKIGTAFTMRELLDANMESKSVGGMFLGGKLLYNEQEFETRFVVLFMNDANVFFSGLVVLHRYEVLPFGLVGMLIPRDKTPSFAKWKRLADQAWMKVEEILPEETGLPPASLQETGAKFDDRTWEWTVARDYYMQVRRNRTATIMFANASCFWV